MGALDNALRDLLWELDVLAKVQAARQTLHAA